MYAAYLYILRAFESAAGSRIGRSPDSEREIALDPSRTGSRRVDGERSFLLVGETPASAGTARQAGLPCEHRTAAGPGQAGQRRNHVVIGPAG